MDDAHLDRRSDEDDAYLDRRSKMDDPHLDRSAWIRSLLDRYEQPLIRYATRITGNTDRARDIVQDTFMRLCEADRAKVEHHAAGWLYAVCRNRALDIVRKEGRMEPLTERGAECLEGREPTPSRIAAGREAYARVVQVVEALPQSQQEAFRLKFQDELTYREIGGVMGMSLGQVSKLLAAALHAIRLQLADELEAPQEG